MNTFAATFLLIFAQGALTIVMHWIWNEEESMDDWIKYWLWLTGTALFLGTAGSLDGRLNESSLHAFIRHQRHTRYEQRMNLDLSNIIKLLPEFYKALGETFIMVGISSVFGIVAGGLLGVWLFVSGERQLFANAAANRILNGVISLMRAFPFVILMIVLMPLTRLIVGTSFGPTAASVSLSVAASFYFARLVEQNLKEVPRGVVEAAQAMGATTMDDKIAAENSLTSALSGLKVSLEAYPDLKANQNFLQLQNELADIENKLAAVRRFFNSATRELNNAVQTFPSNLIAGMFGFKTEPMFEIPTEQRAELDKAPEVKF